MYRLTYTLSFKLGLDSFASLSQRRISMIVAMKTYTLKLRLLLGNLKQMRSLLIKSIYRGTLALKNNYPPVKRTPIRRWRLRSRLYGGKLPRGKAGVIFSQKIHTTATDSRVNTLVRSYYDNEIQPTARTA